MTVLQTRISFGTAMLAAFFLILYLDHFFNTDIFLGCTSLFLGIVGLLEFYKIVKDDDITPLKIPGLICGILIFFNVWISARAEQPGQFNLLNTGTLVILVFLVFFIQGFKGNLTDTLKNISVTIFGVLYVFFLLSFVMAILHMPGGNGVYDFLFVVLVSKVADIGGYLFGRKFGKHKMTPNVSPKKSVEGLIFGLFLSIAVAWLLSYFTDKWILPWQWLTPFALLVSCAGVFGDLAESLIKRGVKVKDAGSCVPEFGGVLDIIDSLLISMPVAYYLLIFAKNTLGI